MRAAIRIRSGKGMDLDNHPVAIKRVSRFDQDPPAVGASSRPNFSERARWLSRLSIFQLVSSPVHRVQLIGGNVPIAGEWMIAQRARRIRRRKQPIEWARKSLEMCVVVRVDHLLFAPAVVKGDGFGLVTRRLSCRYIAAAGLGLQMVQNREWIVDDAKSGLAELHAVIDVVECNLEIQFVEAAIHFFEESSPSGETSAGDRRGASQHLTPAEVSARLCGITHAFVPGDTLDAQKNPRMLDGAIRVKKPCADSADIGAQRMRY
jgi:hypothetical protein